MILALLSLLLFLGGDLDEILAKADELAQQGRYESALKALDEAGDSNDARLLTAKGTYMLRYAEGEAAGGRLSGDSLFMAFDEAASMLESATKQKDAPDVAYVNWSEALLNLDDPAAALEVVNEGASKHRKSLQIALQTGRVHTSLANSNEGLPDKQRASRMDAKKVYEEAMRAHPESAIACVRLGEMEVYLGNTGGAQAAWTEALKRDATAVDIGAMTQWLQMDPSARVLRMVQEETGETPLLQYWQAIAEYGSTPRQWEEAKKHFRNAIDGGLEYSVGWWYLGTGAMEEGQRLQSVDDLQGSEAEYKLAATAWGHYLALYGADYMAGVRQAEDGGAFEIRQKDWLAGRAYGWNLREAAHSISKWVAQASPGDGRAWNNYAFFSREVGNSEEAYAAYRKADSLKPDDPQILNDMALILQYNLKRDLELAKSLYQRSIGLAEKMMEDPESIPEADRDVIRIALRDARNNLALLRRQLGEEDEGEEHEEHGAP